MTALNADGHWARWNDWFPIAFRDVQTLAHHRHVWRNLLAMLISNPDIQHHAIMNDWLVRGYSQTLAVGVRRQSETDRSRPTIGRILKELSSNPDVVTLDRYLADTPDRDVDLGLWASFAGTGAVTLSPDIVSADLSQLLVAAEPCRAWVNRAVAHRDRDALEPAIRYTIDEFNLSLDELCRLVRKYWPLFNRGSSLYRVTPDLPLSWTAMFDVPWRSASFEPVPADEVG